MAVSLSPEDRVRIVDQAIVGFSRLHEGAAWRDEAEDQVRAALARVLGLGRAQTATAAQEAALVREAREILRATAARRRISFAQAARVHARHLAARAAEGLAARGILSSSAARQAARAGVVPFVATTANEILLSRTIGHSVFLERLKTSEANRILSFLDRQVLPDLLGRLHARLSLIRSRGPEVGFDTTRRLGELAVGIDDAVRRGMAQIHGITRESMVSAGIREAELYARLIRTAVPVALETSIPSPSRLREIVRRRPFQGRTLRDWYSAQEDATRRAFRSSVRIGLAEGQSTDAIVRRIRSEIGGTRRGVQSIVRTAINHVTAQARDVTYEENSDLVRGWHFIATLDLRTTLTCANLDAERDENGQKVVHPIGGGPKPPRHIGCRSADAPVLWPASEMGLAELPPATRASLDGAVPETVLFDEWILGQDAARQDAYFGPTRARAFRAGTLPLGRMTDAFGSPLNLDEIVRREGDIFAA